MKASFFHLLKLEKVFANRRMSRYFIHVFGLEIIWHQYDVSLLLVNSPQEFWFSRFRTEAQRVTCACNPSRAVPTQTMVRIVTLRHCVVAAPERDPLDLTVCHWFASWKSLVIPARHRVRNYFRIMLLMRLVIDRRLSSFSSFFKPRVESSCIHGLTLIQVWGIRTPRYQRNSFHEGR